MIQRFSDCRLNDSAILYSPNLKSLNHAIDNLVAGELIMTMATTIVSVIVMMFFFILFFFEEHFF